MKDFFKTLPENIAENFKGLNLVWNALAIVVTFLVVTLGVDWYYFLLTRSDFVILFSWPAAVLGGLLPILLPLTLLIYGRRKSRTNLVILAWALAQAALIGSLVSSFYKSLTGRIQPDLANTLIDSSRQFNFGFLEHGVFWGWPSSHTTIAFAMALTLVALYPDNKKLRFFAILYAIYIGLGVSTTIHWLSEFLAGAIIGSVIGMVVGKSFKKRL